MSGKPTERQLRDELDALKGEDGTPEERFRTALWASLKNYYDAPLSADERRALSRFNDEPEP